MRTFLVVAIILLSYSLSYAAISTTINYIDQSFDGAKALYPVDLDKDGDIDIVGAATNADDILWWENNGSESFTKRTIDANLDGANSIFVIDLDLDGDLDVLATAEVADDVIWYESDGTPRDGGWTTRTIDGAFDGANWSFAMDLDFDGDIDVLATAGTDDDVTWYENDGTPRDGGWTERTIDQDFDGANSIYALDMDKDGDIDVLATANVADDVTWWENDGAPRDGGWTKRTIDVDFDGANSIYAVDMDKDGDIDVLAAADQADDVAWWKNDGTPRDGGWTKYTIDPDFDGASFVFVIDLDFDGDLDVLSTANVADDVSWWKNDGTPSKNNWTEYTIKQDYDGANFVYAIDLDGDGDMDVLSTADTDDDVAWWKNDANLQSGNIGFESESIINGFFNGSTSLYAIDLDVDGDTDIIGAARLADDIIWYKSDGTPNDGGWTEYVVDNNFDGAYDVACIDLDRDGDIDIIAAAESGDELAWWQNNGSGSFTKKSIASDFNGADSIFIIDLDTDGDLDIVSSAGLGDELAWWQNNGSQSFSKKSIDTNLNGASHVFCIDLNRDGDIDILATADVDDDVVWYDNNGSEAFTKRIIDDDFNGAISVKAKDIDIDGDIDVAACAYDGNTIAWWANDGSPSDGGWTEYIIDGDTRGASDINLLDVDLDGDIDIVGSAKLDDDIAWWENDGTPLNGGWTKDTIDSNFDGAISVYSLDLDIDGDIDILGCAENGDDISWWENGGASAVTPAPEREAATPYLSVDFTTVRAPTETVAPAPPGMIEPVETEEGLQEIDVKCFIATASFGTPQAYEVERLCHFRDEYLLRSEFGKTLVNLYYKISPYLAKAILKNDYLKNMVRILIKLLLKMIPA